MATSVNQNSSSERGAPVQPQAPQAPSMMATANKATKVIGGIICGILGVGCLGVAIVLSPFGLEIGLAAGGFATVLFGMAAYLFHSGLDLSSRQTSVIS